MSIRRRDGEVQELRSLETADGYQEVAAMAPSSHSKWVHDDSPFSYGVGSLIAISGALMLVFLYICTCRSQSPSERITRANMIRERRRLRQERQREHARNQAISKARDDPKKREKVFSSNLVVQRIIRTDNDGNLTLGPVDDVGGDISESTDETETSPPSSHCVDGEDSNTCVICFEPFRVGDLVAWSKHSSVSDDCDDEGLKEDKGESNSDNLTVSSSFSEKNTSNQNPKCFHVFHKDCIGEWLLDTKHDDCPFCRTVLLPPESWCGPDKDDGRGYNISSNSVFVIIQGLVSLIQNASQRGQQHQAPDEIENSNQVLGDLDVDLDLLEAGENSPKDLPGAEIPSTLVLDVSTRMVRSASDTFLASSHTSSETSSCDSDEDEGDKRTTLFRNLPSIFKFSQRPSHSDSQQPTLEHAGAGALASQSATEEQQVDLSIPYCQPCLSNDSSFSSQSQSGDNTYPDLPLAEGGRRNRARTLSSASI